MGFTESISVCLRKYGDFRGRATRPEYWWFFLANSVVLVVLDVAHRTSDSAPLAVLQFAVALVLLLPGLAVGSRRLHDTGRTGWWQLIYFVPIVGILVLIYLLTRRGTDDANRFGEPPVPA
jgi:uncharacterized membrane protein YhaH (DUF805 family)